MSRRARRVVEALEPKITEALEPKIIVSEREWRSEIGRIGALVAQQHRIRRRAMRPLALWRWRREPRYLEEYRRLRAEEKRLRREELELRAILKRKVIAPYWRIDVAYQFQETTEEPPYHFYAEFRKYVYTREPDKYAIFNERTGEYTDPKPFMEEELRLIMFASSLLSRITKDDRIAHGAWLEALRKMKVLPFPNFEAQVVDEKEIDAPLDTEQYYVRIEEMGRERPAEYDTEDVLSWLRVYHEWLREMARRGIIRYPERYDRAIRQTSIDEFVERFRRRLEEE